MRADEQFETGALGTAKGLDDPARPSHASGATDLPDAERAQAGELIEASDRSESISPCKTKAQVPSSPDNLGFLQWSFPEARFELIPQTGHFPQIEQPAHLLELIPTFADRSAAFHAMPAE